MQTCMHSFDAALIAFFGYLCEVDHFVTVLIYWRINDNERFWDEEHLSWIITYQKSLFADQELQLTWLLACCGITVLCLLNLCAEIMTDLPNNPHWNAGLKTRWCRSGRWFDSGEAVTHHTITSQCDKIRNESFSELEIYKICFEFWRLQDIFIVIFIGK